MVLALVVNIYGFIKHSSIHEGNFSDCKGIDEVIGSLNKVLGTDDKPVVVIDAGIATEDNLKAIKDKGYHYLCVSRVKLKDYLADTSRSPVLLKTDLDLRPIYHKNDDATVAHLYLGLLAYWLVNTTRCQLKAHGINTCWKEIVRIGSTQKVITTVGYNKAEQEISVRKCSLPEQKLKQLLDALAIKQRPFTKIKSVVHKQKLRKPDSPVYARIPSG